MFHRKIATSLASCCVAIPLLSPAMASGDQFSLKGGGQLRGDLVDPQQENPEHLEIRTPGGGRILLAATEVLDAELLSAEERQYQELLPKMPDTVEGMWAMAEWCRKNRLDEQRTFHLEQILQQQRDHKGARAALGYTKVNDRWIITDDWRLEQGFVRVGATWKLPQEIVLDQHSDDFEEREIQWKKNVKTWRGQLGRRRGPEALQELRAANDPAAAAAYAEALAEEPNRDLRKLYIGVLGNMTISAVANTALVHHALKDVDEQVRDAALDELSRNKVSPAVSTFIRALEDDDPLLINRAAIALSRMDDRRAIVPLINALITEHKQVVRSGGAGQLGATFGGAGGGGLSAGSSVKLLKGQRQNLAVYQTLVTMTGVNYGYNEQAWRHWYASQNMPEIVNLRRDQ
jgi:hypothetical protein